MDWERVKTLPHPTPSLDIDGTTWRVVDEIVMLDKASEARHAFAIHDSKDAYNERSTQRYPDGTVVTDTGHAQLEGTFAFTIGALAAGRPVVILRRIDYIMGNYDLEVFVGDTSAGIVRCDGADRAHRWRNWPIQIAAEHVTATTLNVRLKSLTPNRDVHMFHVWVYQ